MSNLTDQNIEMEEDVIHNISKDKFFTILKKYNIDLVKVSNKKKAFNDDFHRFNLIIKKLKNDDRISMIECAKFLYIDYFKEREVLDCFNEENRYELKREIYKMYESKLFKKYAKSFF
jgi:hypothetical protein